MRIAQVAPLWLEILPFISGPCHADYFNYRIKPLIDGKQIQLKRQLINMKTYIKNSEKNNQK